MSGPSPKSMALRFRIWQYAEPLGWDVAIPEIAEELGTTWQSVRSTLQHAGWLGRVRAAGWRQVDLIGPGGGLSAEKSATQREVIHDIEHGLL